MAASGNGGCRRTDAGRGRVTPAHQTDRHLPIFCLIARFLRQAFFGTFQMGFYDVTQLCRYLLDYTINTRAPTDLPPPPGYLRAARVELLEILKRMLCRNFKNITAI